MGLEDIAARMPVVGPLFGARTDEEKALLKKQQEMAGEANQRREQMQRARLQSLNQQMMAFGPRNQVMAQMFGPEAAFTGEQMAAMTANPMGMPQGAQRTQELDAFFPKSIRSPEDLRKYNENPIGGKRIEWSDDLAKAIHHRQVQDEWRRNEDARQRQISSAFGTPQGPTPIRQTQAAPARRY